MDGDKNDIVVGKTQRITIIDASRTPLAPCAGQLLNEDILLRKADAKGEHKY
jgi:hypothetical protein